MSSELDKKVPNAEIAMHSYLIENVVCAKEINLVSIVTSLLELQI